MATILSSFSTVSAAKKSGFGAVSDFFRIQTELDGVTVRVASNIENALVVLNTPEDELRKRLIKEKTRTLSIDAEQARIREHRVFVEKITKAFKGTEYEDRTEKIIRFIERRDAKTPRLIYTGSMHEFGREDGRAIYQILKINLMWQNGISKQGGERNDMVYK